VARLAFHHSSKTAASAPFGSANFATSCRNVVNVAEKPRTRRVFSNLFKDVKRRITGARNQLADTRAQYQFTVPEPDEYPTTPITAASDSVTDTPESTQERPIAHPIKTGFMLTIGGGLALALSLVVSSNVQLLIWILTALFITLGLDPLVSKIHSWGAPRGIGVLTAVALLIGIITVFMSALVPMIVEQTTEF